jgi:HEAT repeat protein
VSVALRSLGRRLGRSGDFGGEAVERIASRLSGPAPVALAATEALAEMGGPIAARALLPALDREEPEVVRSAVDAIGQHAEEGLLESLLPLLGHPEWSVRAGAARVFSERGLPAALPALLGRIDAEDDPFVREVVLDAISHLEP